MTKKDEETKAAPLKVSPPGLGRSAGKKTGNAGSAVTVKAPPKAKEETEGATAGTTPKQMAPTELPPLGFTMDEIDFDEEEDIWLNILVYGPSGVGKTHLIGTAQDDPETASVFLIDAEAGKATIRFKKGIMHSPVYDFSTIENILEFLTTYCHVRDEYLAAVKNGDKEAEKRWLTNAAILFRIPEKNRTGFELPIYRTVAIDSLTEVQQYDMREIMQDVIKNDPARDPDVPSFREWGKSSGHIRQLIRAFRALPIHKIWAALPAEKTDEKTKEVTVGPDLPGKLMYQVPGLVDIVGYYYSYVDEEDVTQRIMLTQHSGKYMAKDRTSALGRFIENPDIPSIMQRIRDYDAEMLKSKKKHYIETSEAIEDN